MIRIPRRRSGERGDVDATIRPRSETASRRLGQEGVRWRERSSVVRAVRLWRTRNPRTFREKVRYKMLRDHRALVVTFADKAAVRDYVATVIGGRYLPRTYAVVDDPAALRDVSLPDSYVVKPTHGSGAAIVVSDRAPREARLPSEQDSWGYSHVRPESAPREDIVLIARDRRTRAHHPRRDRPAGRARRSAAAHLDDRAGGALDHDAGSAGERALRWLPVPRRS